MRSSRIQTRSRGSTIIELMVSAILLITTISVVSQLTFASGQLWRLSRIHQLAIDDLTNHLERISALPVDQREIELNRLTPSARILQSVQDAKILYEIKRDEWGERLILRMESNPNSRLPPIQLIGWLTTREVQS